MKNILVTGGAGYIGSHTVYELNKNGYNCIILDNFSEGHRKFVEGHKIYEIDLCDTKSVRTIFTENNIDAVIHFAASAYVGESVQNPQKYYKNNVINTLNLLNIMREFNVNRIVFSSTCATYGVAQYLPIDENHPQNPINPYGKTKLVIENIMKDYDKAYGLKFIALRYFNAAGANVEANLGEFHKNDPHIIPNILKTITGEKDCITVLGTDYDTPDGTCIRDYTNVIDLAKAHAKALELLLHNPQSTCINLGTGHGISIKELINTTEEVTRKKIPITYGQRRAGDPDALYASYDKAKELLDWMPEHDIKSSIKSALEWEQRLYSKTH